MPHTPPPGPPAALHQLADRAQRGERPAFEELVRRLEQGLKRVLLRRTGGQFALVEELAQSTWVAVWDALRQGRYDAGRAAISTFVYAVAHKLWLRHLRDRRGPAAEPAALESVLIGRATEADDPAAALESAELLEAMRGCLRSDGDAFSLTPEERRVVIGLAAGESERSLSAELGLAASTIHARKQAAYEKLRRCLAAKGFRLEPAERRAG